MRKLRRSHWALLIIFASLINPLIQVLEMFHLTRPHCQNSDTSVSSSLCEADDRLAVTLDDGEILAPPAPVLRINVHDNVSVNASEITVAVSA